jgi:predicted GIY-YIG superfamily endonuclease
MPKKTNPVDKLKGKWICYCLHNSKKYTYVGITNDFRRRHRQHNGEITGGAKYTRKYRPWSTLFRIHGLTCHKHVLQLEWAMKHRRKKGYSGVKGRVRTLEHLLSLPSGHWTKRAPKVDDCDLKIECKMTKKEYMVHAGYLTEDMWPKRKNVRYLFLREK